MKVNFQIYDQREDVLLAACDEEVLGKTLEDGEVHLEVKENFYGGQKIEIENLKKKFKKSSIANLVGEKVVEAALEAGYGSKSDVMKIDGVPHLQIVRM